VSRRRAWQLFPLTVLWTIVALIAGCNQEAAEPTAQASPYPTESPVAGEARVFAAASLTESFNQIGEAFSGAHAGASVTFNFAASSTLAQQIIEQGRADVFASADGVNMQKVAGAELLKGESQIFIQNRLQIIVQPGNPKRIARLADLANPELKVVMAAPQVPVGRYAREALSKAGVTVRPVSEATDVKGVIGPVTLGEADAGIVYASDVKSARDRATGIAIPLQHNVVAMYPIAVIASGKNEPVGRAFMEFVLSDTAQKILTDDGFVAR
jgi:molybdate transport system substrate-binding protein